MSWINLFLTFILLKVLCLVKFEPDYKVNLIVKYQSKCYIVKIIKLAYILQRMFKQVSTDILLYHVEYYLYNKATYCIRYVSHILLYNFKENSLN